MNISGHDWKDLILFCLSFMFGSVLVGGLEVIKMFIQSKPPGRRLVRDLQLCRLTVSAAGDRGHPRVPGGLPAGALWDVLSGSHDQGRLQVCLLLGNFHHRLADNISARKGFL